MANCKSSNEIKLKGGPGTPGRIHPINPTMDKTMEIEIKMVVKSKWSGSKFKVT